MLVATTFVSRVTVVDPDTKNPVDVEIRKLETGQMVGLDCSFLEQIEDHPFSPYDKGVTLDIPESES